MELYKIIKINTILLHLACSTEKMWGIGSSIEEITQKYSFNELNSMYFAIFDSNPISYYNKTRVAQTIYNYIYAMDRADSLLK